MSRREADFYPTPPCAVEALRMTLQNRAWLPEPGQKVLDPAAGAGTMLEWLEVPREDRYAMELRDDPRGNAYLRHYIPEANIQVGVDSLQLDWSFADMVVANPPFNQLDAFVPKLYQASRTAHVVAFITPTQWWQAGKVRGHLPKPQLMVALTWRAPFMGKGAAMHDVAWCIYTGHMPAWRCEFEWADRPYMPRRGEDADPRWVVFDDIQPG